MINISLFVDKRLTRNILQLYKQCYRRLHKTGSLNINPNNVKEVEIPVPWGHIAAKWWGDSSKQPIIALHGWQDNASTFDPLLELLPDSLSVLAVDNPGHGLSTHYPEAMLYSEENYILMCRRIQKYYKWTEPITIIGHSLGAAVGFMFTAIYPQYVNNLVLIDGVKPLIRGKEFWSKLGKSVDSTISNLTISAQGNRKYSIEELEKRWIEGTRGSLSSSAVKILMRRGVKLDIESGKYTFTRDLKIKNLKLHFWDENLALEFASNIKCNLLAVRFSEGKFFDATLKYSPTYLSTLEKAAKSFKLVNIEGTHHCHLNTPEYVAPVITEFLSDNNLL